MKTGYPPSISDEKTDIFQHSNQFMLKQIYSKCKNIIKIYTTYYSSGLHSGPTCMYNFSMLYELDQLQLYIVSWKIFLLLVTYVDWKSNEHNIIIESILVFGACKGE